MSSEVGAKTSEIDLGYYSNERAELLDLVPSAANTLLDIGCGAGGFGSALLARRPNLEVWGVEPVETAALLASRIYRRVLVGGFPEASQGVDLPQFDCIAFNDVLEHMVDPWSALAYSRSLLTDDGTILVSLPNVASLGVLKNILRGRWDYEDWGVLDRTHLRFFTATSGAEMIEGAGFTVMTSKPYFWLPARRATRMVFKLHPRLKRMLYAQTIYVARKRAG